MFKMVERMFDRGHFGWSGGRFI